MPPALRTQLVVDTADPHALAAFWAEALRYEHEEIGDFVQGLLDAGHVPEALTIEIDGARRWKDLASLRHPDDGVDERGAGTGRRILFQAVPEPKTVKNRVHLDLVVGPDAADEEVGRLVALGATVVSVHDGPDGRWTLLVDPEGNEFDVA
jgi:Glyoxalase-like domain